MAAAARSVFSSSAVLAAATSSARRSALATGTFSTSPLARASSSSASSSSSSSSPTPASEASAASVGEGKDPQLGDYPDLPPISLQRRRWSPNWWDGQEKRNFGETLHEQHDALSVWAPDAAPIPPSQALFQFTLAGLAISAFCGLVYLTKFERVSVPRTYPRGGLQAEMGGTALAALSDEAEGESADDEE
ncbi:hypothetical protein OC834_002458 [Tilletia horrida]|nr:hypothetical protein OC834_002458 [Tilletia horrida]